MRAEEGHLAPLLNHGVLEGELALPDEATERLGVAEQSLHCGEHGLPRDLADQLLLTGALVVPAVSSLGGVQLQRPDRRRRQLVQHELSVSAAVQALEAPSLIQGRLRTVVPDVAEHEEEGRRSRQVLQAALQLATSAPRDGAGHALHKQLCRPGVEDSLGRGSQAAEPAEDQS